MTEGTRNVTHKDVWYKHVKHWRRGQDKGPALMRLQEHVAACVAALLSGVKHYYCTVSQGVPRPVGIILIYSVW